MTIKCNKYDRKLKTLPKTYVAIDLELTGNYCLNYIIELAALKVRDGVIIDEFSSLVRPPDYNVLEKRKGSKSGYKAKKIKSTVNVDGQEIYYIDEFIEDLTGISNEMIYSAEDETHVIKKFHDFIGDLPVIGHGMGNDIREIKDSFDRILDKDFENPCIDTFDLGEFAYGEKFSLIRLCDHLGIDNSDVHRARSDAYRAHLSYLNLLDDLDSKYGETYSQEFFQWMDRALMKQNRILKNRVMRSINAKNWSLKRQAYLEDHRLDLDFFNSKICLSNRIKLKNMPDFKNLAGEYNLKFTTSLDLECDYYIVKNFIYYTEDLDKQYIKKIVDLNRLGKSIRIMSIGELVTILENFEFIDDWEDDDCLSDIDFKDKRVFLYNDFNYESKDSIGKKLGDMGAIIVDDISGQVDYVIVGEGFDKPIFYDSKEYEILLAYLALGHNICVINEKKFWELTEVNEGEA